MSNDPNVYGNLASALAETMAMEEAERAYESAMRCPTRSPVIESNYVYFLNDTSHHTPQEIFQAHLRWADFHAGRRAASAIDEHPNKPDPSRKLRIGYVSADFRMHSVAYFIEPILARHNHEQFEVICFADELKSDEVTGRLQAYADRWHRITGWDHDRVIRLVREEQIDILIDLGGHTGPNRLLVFASKPAPVQITYLGYPATTGLSTIDYRITDAVADPPGMTERFFAETLLRLPDCFLCYCMPASAAPVVASAPPASKNKRITFGSFNNIVKVSPRVLGLWARILQDVSNSRLVLKARGLDDPPTRQAILDRLKKFGVAVDRVDLWARHATLAEHLASYGQIDIALDTYPYHGTTTTCEALIMGVPVISLAGETHVSRVGASLLTTVGHPELIAETDQQYIAKAVELAADLPRLSELRQKLRRDVLASPLADEERFVLNLEAAYRDVWSKWCNTKRR